MFRLKLQYLTQENLHLKKQVDDLKKILAIQSQPNEQSLIYQMRQEKQEQFRIIQSLNDELLLQRQVRVIEQNRYEQNLLQLNAYIFQLNQSIKRMEDILKQQDKIVREPGIIEKWIKQKFERDKNQVYHKYADPLLFFQVLQAVLDSTMYHSDTEDQTSERTPACKFQETAQNMKQNQPWFTDKSGIYFLSKKRGQNLHLKLRDAKLLQYTFLKSPQKSEGQLSNMKLLKESYVNLIAEYQIMRKKMIFYEKYIRELQSRNQLLINSNLEAVDDQ